MEQKIPINKGKQTVIKNKNNVNKLRQWNEYPRSLKTRKIFFSLPFMLKYTRRSPENTIKEKIKYKPVMLVSNLLASS